MPGQKKSSSIAPTSGTLIPTRASEYSGAEYSGAVVPTTDLLTDKAKEQEKKGGKELKKEVEEQQEKLQEYGMKINWDNITVDDVAILALLSAFLVVMAPGALPLPVALAAFRTLSFEIGLDLGKYLETNNELGGTPSSNPSRPEGKQLGEDRGVNTSAAA